MKKTVYFNDFINGFEAFGRGDSFSYDGFRVLYDYLIDLEEAIGEELEFDIIAIDCDFTEYDNIEDFQVEYGLEYQDLEDIGFDTIVLEIPYTERFIIQVF